MVTPEEFLSDLKQKALRIKIFNLGENIGQDFAYFGHYLLLKRFFPNVYLHLCRSNVDETNCIGQENYQNKVRLPVDKFSMAVVKQRYENGKDWVQKINSGILDIFSPQFLDVKDYDYLWAIGMASSPAFLNHFPSVKQIGSNIVQETIEFYNQALPDDLPINIPSNCPNLDWARTTLEYLCYKDKGYPFAFLPEFKKNPLATQYKDYLRIGLRLPEFARWYYSVDQQYKVIFSIIERIKKLGLKAKIVYSLKDGEIDNNFLKGQSIELLKKVQDTCDDILFTYSWTKQPYFLRPSEEEELAKLRKAGITNVKKVDIWEDLLLSNSCKVYLSEPGGFAEVMAMTRRKVESTFLFPASCSMVGVFLTLNREGKPIRMKINPTSIKQIYLCKPVLSEDRTRVKHWFVSYDGETEQIGEDCHGDDWKYFKEAEESIFARWFKKTKDELVNTIVEEYAK